jgi:hypothetical protein
VIVPGIKKAVAGSARTTGHAKEKWSLFKSVARALCASKTKETAGRFAKRAALFDAIY